LGGEAAGIICDVPALAAVDAAMKETVATLGAPTLVVTAAGIIRIASFLQLEGVDFARELAVNLTGTFLTVQACARAMVERQLSGAMVCVASVAGRGPRADSAGYAASKAGVISVVRSAAVALAPQQIRVNAVCPGIVDTTMTRRIAAVRAKERGITLEEALQSQVDRVPLGRMQRTNDVADVALFLLSDAASYVTGQALNACGGLEFD
jgi:NAD(P)-dependent dehydrogenase (short-subunit alcohol dehydrogenase family)